MELWQERENLRQLKEIGAISEKDFEVQNRILDKKYGVGEAVFENTDGYTMMEAVHLFFKKSFTWRGRACRSEFWWVVLFHLLLGFACIPVLLIYPILLLVAPIFTLCMLVVFSFGYVLYGLFAVFPYTSLVVRRTHDFGLNAWVALTPMLVNLLCLGISSYMVMDMFAPIFGMLSSGQTANIESYFLSYAMTHADTFRIIDTLYECSIILFLIQLVMFCFPGTKGPNRYGTPRI